MMARLFKEAMVPEVFASPTAVSNNIQALIAGRAAHPQLHLRLSLRPKKEVQEIAKDVYFTPALKGPRGTRGAAST